MKYILILGNGYKDCKDKENSINKLPDTKYPYVTKVKHVTGIDFSDYVMTNNFVNNPNYDDILNTIKTIKGEIPVESDDQLMIDFTEPTVEENIKEVVDELVNLEEEEPKSLYFQPVVEDDFNAEEELTNVLADAVAAREEDEVVEEIPVETEEVIEEEIVEEIPAEDDSDEIKPVGDDVPRGWHARNEYIDEVGNLFHKGKFVRNINDEE